MTIYDQQFINAYKNFVFDFDGVIKNSVSVKGEAFADIFSKSEATKKLIINHHNSNGGVSRFEKIPVYLRFCGEEVSEKNIKFYSEKFSLLVKEKVVSSDWIPGFMSYANYLKIHEKSLYILSATPQHELREIACLCKLDSLFEVNNIIGSPMIKSDYLKILKKLGPVIFFGDAMSDYDAARISGVDFVQCKTNGLFMDDSHKSFQFTITDFIKY